MDTSRLNTTLVSPAPLSEGQGSHDEILLGRYRVLARCGTGGFGTVCTCWDTRLQRRVAIKRMPLATQADGRMLASTVDEALAEARTACLLAHPNIVTVFDFEVEGSYAYLVMEYVDGLNLSELLQRVEGGVLTHAEAAHVLQSITSALSYAHENGALHLDIKPTNIMIDRSGTVKLADFGMATLASAAGYGGARGGTVGYMPPEQIKGELVDERADLFSLAVVMWQAITGKNPFASTTAKNSMDRIARGPKPTIGKLDPNLAGEADAAFNAALAPDPAQRLASVESFADHVLPSLASAEMGKDSLIELVGQSEEDETLSHESISWEERHLPFLDRFPWAEAAFERTLAAVFTFIVAQTAASPLLTSIENGPLIAAIACGLAAALWPPLGSLAVAGFTVFSLGMAVPSSVAFPFAVGMGIVALVWWIGFGMHDHLATPAFLAPAALSWPFGGVQLAAYALAPGSAFICGAGSYVFALVFSLAKTWGFDAEPVARALLEQLMLPQTWILIAGAGISAAISAAITERGSVAAGIVGQVLCAGLIVGTQVLALRVENGSFSAMPPAEGIALAVILCVLLCIATALRGPLIWDQEGESYELSQ